MRPGFDVPLVLFDGDCGFCNRSVQFIWRNNTKRNILFAPLKSQTAAQLAIELHKNAWNPETMVLIDKGKVYEYSSAALRITKYLRGGWKLLYALLIVPPFIRDFFYKRVAANRHKLGKNCPVPDSDLVKRTLK